ncbi:hypothetical protein FKM82_017557 [Ascaphus truei]
MANACEQEIRKALGPIGFVTSQQPQSETRQLGGGKLRVRPSRTSSRETQPISSRIDTITAVRQSDGSVCGTMAQPYKVLPHKPHQT